MRIEPSQSCFNMLEISVRTRETYLTHISYKEEQAPLFKSMKTPWDDLFITRMPSSNDPNLQGWDGADLYLLDAVAERGYAPAETVRVLIVNDTYGAISTALRHCQVDVVTDSFRGREGLKTNFEKNLADHQPHFYDLGKVHPDKGWDLILIKIPKSHDLLDWQLSRLQSIAGSAVVIGSGLTKHVHKKTIKIFERYLGKTPTSLAKYRSRLLLPGSDKIPSELQSNVWPKFWEYHGLAVGNYPGVFSGEKLDQGTRFLMEQWQQGKAKYTHSSGGTVIDLGCGNAVLSAYYMKNQYVPIPMADKGTDNKHVDGAKENLIAIDDSWQAICSAKKTYSSNGVDAHLIHGDGLKSLPADLAAIILCNPPFHEGHGVSYELAAEMFSHALRVLEPGGKLWVVGNRHLRYHIVLKRLFSRVQQIGNHPKFVIFQCWKR